MKIICKPGTVSRDEIEVYPATPISTRAAYRNIGKLAYVKRVLHPPGRKAGKAIGSRLDPAGRIVAVRGFTNQPAHSYLLETDK